MKVLSTIKNKIFKKEQMPAKLTAIGSIFHPLLDHGTTFCSFLEIEELKRLTDFSEQGQYDRLLMR